jgi:hypothetical protein
VLDPWRRDSTTIIVAIGYPRLLVPEVETGCSTKASAAHGCRVVAGAPTFSSAEEYGPAPRPWVAAAGAVGVVSDRRVRAAGRHPEVRTACRRPDYRHGDSALCAGPPAPLTDRHRRLSFFPSPYVGGGIQIWTADRWMRATPTT